MKSQCTKYEVSRFTRYKAMNGGAKCRKWGGLRWLEGTQGQCHHSIERIRLPIRLNRNHASILYRFRDIAGYLSKVADFDPPHLHLAPPQGVIPVEFRGVLWHKLESLGYRVVLLCDPTFSRFSRTPTRDGRTDRQTDRRTQGHG